MIFTIPTSYDRAISRCGKWYLWFAWYPVRITRGVDKDKFPIETDRKVWLQKVNRRDHIHSTIFDGWWTESEFEIKDFQK